MIVVPIVMLRGLILAIVTSMRLLLAAWLVRPVIRIV